MVLVGVEEATAKMYLCKTCTATLLNAGVSVTGKVGASPKPSPQPAASISFIHQRTEPRSASSSLLDELNGAESRRAESLMIKAGHNAIRHIQRQNKSDVFQRGRGADALVNALEVAIRAQCSKIINAAKVKPGVIRTQEIAEGKRKAARLEAAAVARAERKVERDALARDLRKGRERLFEINQRIAQCRQRLATVRFAVDGRDVLAYQLKRARDKLKELRDTYKRVVAEWPGRAAYLARDLASQPYPDVPAPFISPSFDGAELPETSGIYFLWAGDAVEYVGQSVNLRGRVRLPGHHRLKSDHRISFVFVDAHELDWAECWYIGALKPKLNFGSLAAHLKATAIDINPT